MKALDILMNEFSDLDPKEEEFRYTTTTKDKKLKRSLDGIQHVNVRNLYEVMGRIDSLLSCRDYAISEVRDSCEDMRSNY